MLNTILRTIEFGQVVHFDITTFEKYFKNEEGLDKLCREKDWKWIKVPNGYRVAKNDRDFN